MNTSEILNRAADLIEERGWGTGPDTWRMREGHPVCLEGAIGGAMGRVVNSFGERGISPDDLNLCPAGAAVREYLSEWFATQPPSSWLCHWNDLEAGSADRVIEVLRAAAVVEAARESAPASVAVSS